MRRRARVLIVDDNDTNRTICAAICDMAGYAYEVAEDGQAAVAAVRTGGYDLVLMDIRMPRMDGLSATREIRALEGPESQVPIIAVTTEAGSEESRAYLQAGMVAVVGKPLDPKRLIETMQAVLED